MHNTAFVAILTSSVLTACGGGNSSSPPDAAPDAPPDTPPLPGTSISVETDTAPALIAVKDGTGPWQPVTPAGGSYTLEVHGAYMVTVVCDDGAGGITTWQTARTLDDDRELFLPCGLSDATFSDASGSMAQPGRVTLGFSSDQSATPNWDFSLFVEDGPHDLVAVGADRIAIRRDLVVGGPITITPQLDVVQQGEPLAAAPLAATNAAAGETVSAAIRLVTPSFTFARIFDGSPDAVKLAPASVLVAGDRQTASVTATLGSTNRSLRRGRFQLGDPAEFTLPDPLGGAQFSVTGTTLEVTWETLPAHDVVDASLDAFSDDFTQFWFHDLELSAAYIAATGATGATFDLEIPGYKPEWRIDFAKEYNRGITAFAFGANESASSSLFETVNAPLPRLRSGRAELLADRVMVARERRAAR